MTLSVAMIVKDEEEVLERCLNCVKNFADEIIIVDSGSTDATKKIAARFTEFVYDFEWVYDFSAARNFAISKATCDLVMWLDADDVIDGENIEKIKKIKNDDTFDLGYLYYVIEENGEEKLKYFRERIFRRSLKYYFFGVVHEVIVPRGRVKYFDAKIVHCKLKTGDPLRNINLIFRQLAAGKNLEPRLKYYFGRELLSLKAYRQAITVFEDFLSSDGWVENKIDACICLGYAYNCIFLRDMALNSFLRSFAYAPPRSEGCCGVAAILFDDGKYEAAAYWYKVAIECKSCLESGAFVNPDFCGFIPNIRLAVIYDRLGKFDLAEKYNDEAGKIKPCDPAYLGNKDYFNKLKEQR